MKKKIIALVLSALMLMSVLPLAAAADTGDVDSNGKVDSADARTALRAAVGLHKLTAEEMLLADVDSDGDVDATDARLILRAAVGLETLHTHSYTSAVTTAATCEKKGVTTFTCSCGDSYTEDIAATGHTAVTDEAVPATCTEKGLSEGAHCSVCKKVIKAQEEVAALGHTEVKDKAEAPTCAEKGLTEGSHCSVCNKLIKAQEEIPAFGHTVVKEEAVPATCTEKGLTAGEYCSVCNALLKAPEEIPALGHTIVTDEAVSATCTEKGLSAGAHCSACNMVTKAQKEVPALGHYPVEIEALEPSCTKDGRNEGIICKDCNASLEGAEIIPAFGHTEVIDPAVPPTENSPGLTEGSHCSVCNAVIRAQQVIYDHEHDFRAISLTGTTRCAEDGCNAVLPAFNDIVNTLKTSENGINYYTGIFEDIEHYDKPQVSGLFAGALDSSQMAASTSVSYLPLDKNRLITKDNFHSRNTDYVSTLTDSDVKSITIEKVSGVGFVSSLPDKFTSGKTEYDLTDIKGREYPALYKVTIVLPDQSIDITKPVTGVSVYDKIYAKDYNKTLEATRAGIAQEFDVLAKEMEGMAGMMTNSGTVRSSLVVEYYINANSLAPVAARYNHVFDISFDIGVGIFLSMLQKTSLTSNSYYFFTKSF